MGNHLTGIDHFSIHNPKKKETLSLPPGATDRIYANFNQIFFSCKNSRLFGLLDKKIVLADCAAGNNRTRQAECGGGDCGHRQTKRASPISRCRSSLGFLSFFFFFLLLSFWDKPVEKNPSFSKHISRYSWFFFLLLRLERLKRRPSITQKGKTWQLPLSMANCKLVEFSSTTTAFFCVSVCTIMNDDVSASQYDSSDWDFVGLLTWCSEIF